MKFTLRWHVFVVLLATGFILYSPILIFNTHTFQKWLLSKAMVLDPWQADWKSFRFEPIPPRFKIRGLQITHPQGHSVALDELYLRIKLWHLVKGQLGIDPLRIQNVTVHLAKRPKLEEKEEKKERKFPLSTILLFENLHLDPVQIINTQIYLPNGEVLTIPSFELKLKPVLLRGTSLAINIDNPSFVNTLKKETSLQNIHLEVNTDLKKWRRKFPYLNDLTGDLLITNKEGKEFPFKTIDAKIKFLDNKIFSEKFEIQVGKQPLNGKLETDLVEETYQVTFQTPTGLLIPELESPNRTFDVAGKLTMNMTLEGKGYSLKTSQGKGSLEATHSFDINPEAPVMVKTAFTWSNGAVQIPDAKATTQEATLFARGSIDLSPPALHLKGETKDFPIQRFFEKMNDTNLHPIHGSGDAQATIEGIGDTLHLQVSGEVTDGGYGVLKAEKAVVALEMTSKLLTIGGELFRGDRKTVGADFKITYGKRPFPGAPRPFKTHLDAKFTGEPLDQLLPGLLPSREAARGGGSAGSAGGGGDACPDKTLISGEADATISLDGVEK
ncbi:MAG: hypothetical protein Q7S68_00620, partial [Deltaproteobacteria bacterium]|nr:hypothetical protein [Deltaproteobacteria bacterium]